MTMFAAAPSAIDDAAVDAAAARAWPARERASIGPWLARDNGGVSRRANSVAVLGAAHERSEIDGLIAQCEAFYRERAAICRFQVSDTPRTVPVAAALLDVGYAVEPKSTTLVQTAAPRALRQVAPPERDGRVLIADGPSEAWLQCWWAASPPVYPGVDLEEAQNTLTELLWEIPARCGFAAHVVEGATVATGLGVVDGSYLGLFCAATAPERRHRGSARRLLGALATWGLAQAAKVAYVQVAEDNAPSRRLTEAAGFTTAYRYRYLSRG